MPPITSTPLSIEVLICTHNRLELLKRTLNYLNTADRPENCTVTVLVIANACTDATIDFLSDYEKKVQELNSLHLKWYAESKPGKSNALNYAIPKLTGAVTAMIDDDHRVDKYYFQAINQAITEYPDADFFCGKILPDWDGSEPHWVHDQGKYRIYPLPVPRFDLGDEYLELTRNIAVPGGGNLVVKTDLFKKIGLFSTNLGPVGHNLGGAEDYDWVTRAYTAKAKLLYIPDLVQYHFVDKDRLKTSYLIKKAFERSSSTVKLSETARSFNGFFPLYLVRKTLSYFFSSLLSLTPSARRFYLVRLAAALGEIKGFIMAVKN